MWAETANSHNIYLSMLECHGHSSYLGGNLTEKLLLAWASQKKLRVVASKMTQIFYGNETAAGACPLKAL